MNRLVLVSSVLLLSVSAFAETELYFTQDGHCGVSRLLPEQNLWWTHEMNPPERMTQEKYSCLDIDFFHREFGRPFPVTPFEVEPDGKEWRTPQIGYKKGNPQPGIRFGRDWQKYGSCRWGIDIELEQNLSETEWKLVFNKVSGWSNEKAFKVRGRGQVRAVLDGDLILEPLEVSGLELMCVTPGAKGTIRSLRLVPRVYYVRWKRTFTLPERPVRGGISFPDRPLYRLLVNGHEAASGSELITANGVARCDVSDYLCGGQNEVFLEIECGGGYGARTGLPIEIFAVQDDGRTTRIGGDAEWRCSTDRGETWQVPSVSRSVFGLVGCPAGPTAIEHLPLHAGPLMPKPVERCGYPVFDFDRPIEWTTGVPKGVKDPCLETEIRNNLTGEVVAKQSHGAAAGGRITLGPGLKTGAYEIRWTLSSAGRKIDECRTEMLVAGPVEQTFVDYDGFEKLLKSRLRLVQEIDCTKTYDETNFLDHTSTHAAKPTTGVSRLGEEKGFRFREAVNGGDYFAYKLNVEALGEPHILEVDVPDIRDQTLYCWIAETFPVNFCNNAFPVGHRAYANATGAMRCGDLMPLTDRMRTLRVVFFPASKNIGAVFERGPAGGPLAVCGARVYRVEGGLPALKIPETERRYANHCERPVFASWGAHVNPCVLAFERDVHQNAWTAAYAAIVNRIAYLRYCGHNAAIEGVYMYSSRFPTRSGHSLTPTPDFDFAYATFKMYGHNGIHAYAGYEYVRSPLLTRMGAYNVSDREIAQGTARGVYSVMKDGRQLTGYAASGLNYLCPAVFGSMTNLLGEIYARYSGLPAVEGLWTINGFWWLPGIPTMGGVVSSDVGYDDDSIELFERETGIQLGCGWSGVERFGKRHALLNGQYAKEWYGWRCRRIRRALETMKGVVNAGSSKWELLSSSAPAYPPVNPFTQAKDTRAEQETVDARLRAEGGFDMSLFGEGSDASVTFVPQSNYGRELDLAGYGRTLHDAAKRMYRKMDALYFSAIALNEHIDTRCRAAKRWWWRTGIVSVFDVKPAGPCAFFDLVDVCADYTPKYAFHTWLDVNLTTGHAEECRRFVTGFYATPLDRNPQPVPAVKGVSAHRYRDAVQLVNGTPWAVSGSLRYDDGRAETLTIGPYGIVVRRSVAGGTFRMDGSCPYPDYETARRMREFNNLKAEHAQTGLAPKLANQKRLLDLLAKEGVARIDAGKATDTVDEQGRLWLADQTYASSAAYGNEFAVFVDRGNVAITNTPVPSVYRTEAGGAQHAYHFPVPAGRYDLVCHFAETWDTKPGRILNVTVNGVKKAVDTWKTAGGRFTAGTFTFSDVAVSNGGEITYECGPGAIVNGFEIKRK